MKAGRVSDTDDTDVICRELVACVAGGMNTFRHFLRFLVAVMFTSSLAAAQPTPLTGTGDQTTSKQLTAHLSFWWHQAIQQPLGIATSSSSITADEAMLHSLSQSPDIQIYAIRPQIERTEITRQQAVFDWTQFLETTWNDRNEPIGNTLTTGFLDGRFIDQQWNGAGGARKVTSGGGTVEVAERLGWQDNNSNFLVPNPQSTSRFEVTLTQPLMAGRGESYNSRRVVEARLLAQGSRAESIAKIQAHLLQVHERYWQLYLARVVFLQHKRAADQASELYHSLSMPSRLDVTSRELYRAHTAAMQRQAELINAATAADLAAIEFRRTAGLPRADAELIPGQIPSLKETQTELSVAVQHALTKRAEIDVAVRAIRAASLRVGASKNELLPRLDLIAGTYVAGLTRGARFEDAFVQQFSDGRPTYHMGLAWERAVGNRAAKSLLLRRQLELQESMSRYEAAIQDVQRDVEVAVHQVHLTYRALQNRCQSLSAIHAEAMLLLNRWQTAPNSDGPAIVLLDDLIDAQARLVAEENATATAESEHAVAHVRYLHATGTLLQASAAAQGQHVQHAMIDGDESNVDNGQFNDMPVNDMPVDQMLTQP